MPLVARGRFSQNPRWKRALAVCALGIVSSIPAWGQDFFTLYNFNQPAGDPAAAMTPVQGRDGNFYGTTFDGGSRGEGTVFRLTPSGSVTILYNFCSEPNCADGQGPGQSLRLGVDGNLYGTVQWGGNPACNYESDGCGTVFKITPEGVLTTLHEFDNFDGATPNGPLLLGLDGNIYGTTCSAGPNGFGGTIFKMTPSGDLTTLHGFGEPGDGWCPVGALAQAADGSIYGTTLLGGGTDSGTVFRITPSGSSTVLHSFCSQADTDACADGWEPQGGVVQASDGSFYGTTEYGGADKAGTIFRITPEGRLTTVYSFTGSNPDFPHGAWPYSTLIQATDGSLYGTTLWGGTSANCAQGCGTIFALAPEGSLNTEHSFDYEDGAGAESGLLQSTNGNFYGAAFLGGVNGWGTAYELSNSLGPFVALVSYMGRVGETGGILGQEFTTAYKVEVNGIQAKFTVVSDTYIEATIPEGATSGYVTVTTNGGTFTSNKPFQVIR
ncbi:MAG: choice-of-anchor tandem repeat GloVer-containing protein [Candidatus Sulfotelmatobacter sp.]